jgi:ABC-type transporter Mla subunit MlaD
MSPERSVTYVSGRSDEALAGQTRESVKNAQQATTDLSHASHQADALISDLNSQQIRQKAGAVIGNLNGSAQQVRQMTGEIN